MSLVGKTDIDFTEIFARFLLGGMAVVMCYVISVYSPVKFIGGIFAAFPAVMGAAVIMAGIRDGSAEAGDVARGAVAGMIGSTACVISALYLIRTLNSWPLGLAAAITVWLAVAVGSNRLIPAKRRQSGN